MSTAHTIGFTERSKSLVTFFRNEAAKTQRVEHLTLEELRDKVLSTAGSDKKSLPWLKLARFDDPIDGVAPAVFVLEHQPRGMPEGHRVVALDGLQDPVRVPPPLGLPGCEVVPVGRCTIVVGVVFAPDLGHYRHVRTSLFCCAELPRRVLDRPDGVLVCLVSLPCLPSGR